MQGLALCYVPYVLLRVGLLLSLLQHCHNASLPPDHPAPKGSSESVVYSSNDRADNQRAHTAQSNHLPTPTGTNQKDLTLYSGEKPGEKQAEGLLQTIPVSTSQPPTAPLTTSEPLVVQPPTSVRLEFINVSAVLITWSYPDEEQHLSNPVHFLVRYSHDGDPYVNAAGSTRERSYVFSGMLYGGYYQFQVVAILDGTTSQPTTTDYFISGITAPPGPPTSVKATTLSPSEIELEWVGPLSPTPLLYIIQWGENPTSFDKEKEVYQSTHITFGDLEPGHTYYFRMRADISGRLSILTNNYSATTFQIDLPPVHILVEQCLIHTTWIVVQWSRPSDHRFPLPINSFTVYYGERKMENPSATGNNSLPKCGGDEFPHSDTVPGDAYTVNVTRLDPGATYVFCVGYSSGKFMSDWSASQELITLDDVNCSSCAPYSSTAVLLKWSSKSSSQDSLPHPLLVYEVTHTRTLVANYTSNTSELSQTTEGELLVSDLRPWRNYMFELGYPSPVGLGAVWTKCPTSNCHTREGIPSAPPTNMTVLSTMATSTTLTLTWDAPPIDTLNGRLIAYTFMYRCHPIVTCPAQTCPELLHRVPVLDKERKTSYKFDDLWPFTNYSFEVAAETSAGHGPFSFSVAMETKQTAPSGPPENVTLIEVAETSLSLQWEAPPGCSWNGVIVRYIIRVAIMTPSHQRLHFGDFLNPLTNDTTVISTEDQFGAQLLHEISVPGTRADIQDLQPRTVYSIIVAAATSEGIGPFSVPVIASTLESVINRSINMNLSVNIAERTTEECFAVNVSWQQLLSQESSLFPANSTNNVTVYGNWEYLIHFVSLTTGINNSGVVTVNDNDSFYTLPADSLVQGARYNLWITVDVLLSNGTTLHLHSHNVTTLSPACSVGPDNSTTWTVAAVVLVIFLLVLLAVCLLSVCFYRWLKMSSMSGPMLINMESYTSDVIDSEEGSHIIGMETADRQRGDGWSSSSTGSSEESIKSGSSVAASDESADADSREVVGPGESAVGVASLPTLVGTPLWPEHNEGYVRLSDCTSANDQPLHDLPLAPRQQPDGCSISSSSSQSSLNLLLYDS